MTPVFADTAYFIALSSVKDAWHPKATAFSQASDSPILTTTWVLTELADGLSRSPRRSVFLDFLAGLEEDPQQIIVEADQSLWNRGKTLFANRLDKDWSLTDCISFVVMLERGLTDALTSDHHFEQAGFNILLK